jgi:hypothetical protein
VLPRVLQPAPLRLQRLPPSAIRPQHWSINRPPISPPETVPTWLHVAPRGSTWLHVAPRGSQKCRRESKEGRPQRWSGAAGTITTGVRPASGAYRRLQRLLRVNHVSPAGAHSLTPPT